MQNPTLLVIFLLFFGLSSVAAQCPSGFSTVKLVVNSDEYYHDISWKLTNYTETVAFGQGQCYADSLHTLRYCIPDSTCAIFTMQDDSGDGLVPDGWYKLYLNDSLIRENTNYGYADRTYLGCQPGEFCGTARPMYTDSAVVASGSGDNWYRFIPSVNGTYRLSTCEGNTCPTKIWVYDHCYNIFLSNNQTGATYYSDSGCAYGAVATLFLQKGHTYYFRLGRTSNACANAPFYAKLTYIGPVKGCLDPKACNYQPLATETDTCYYPGDPHCTDGPDLVVMKDLLYASVLLDTIHNPDQCAIDEGCLRGLGVRHVLKFSTKIKNIGNRDYFIGTPPHNPLQPSTQFIWDPCHYHWHYRGYAEYILRNQNGEIPVGTKNGFCVLDLECEDGGRPKYTCDKMGISAQCSDTYDFDLPCQWIDITGLPAGFYTLAVRVNWTQQADTLGQVETNYDNNIAQVCFNLQYNGQNPVIQLLDVECESYRDCFDVPLGNAVPDCMGVCNGPALYGDLNQDIQQTDGDVRDFLNKITDGTAALTRCNDLYGDSIINIADAALLQECLLHHDDPDYWGVRLACHFPILPDLHEGAAFLYAGKLDTIAKTFDIRILNTPNKVSAFEMTVSGLLIDSVVNLTQLKGDIRFNQQGKIVGLATNEQFMERHQVPGDMLRIHYRQLTDSKVCIQQVEAVTNNRYKPMNARIAVTNCTAATSFVATQEPDKNAFAAFVQPNPVRDRTMVYMNNPSAKALHLNLYDWAGRRVRTWQDVRAESLEILSADLVSGVYWLQITNGAERVVVKVVVEGGSK